MGHSPNVASTRYGQVYVTSYYDGDASKLWFVPLSSTNNPYFGTGFLGTEKGYIKKKDVTAYFFNYYYEADAGDTYTFTYYYGDDSQDKYTGTVYYPVTGTYYYPGWKSPLRLNKTGQQGYYEITGMSYTGDPGKYGQVSVDWYYDRDASGQRYRPVNYTGANYLWSESGYIISSGVSAYRFGLGWWEADVE